MGSGELEVIAAFVASALAAAGAVAAAIVSSKTRSENREQHTDVHEMLERHIHHTNTRFDALTDRVDRVYELLVEHFHRERTPKRW